MSIHFDKPKLGCQWVVAAAVYAEAVHHWFDQAASAYDVVAFGGFSLYVGSFGHPALLRLHGDVNLAKRRAFLPACRPNLFLRPSDQKQSLKIVFSLILPGFSFKNISSLAPVTGSESWVGI